MPSATYSASVVLTEGGSTIGRRTIAIDPVAADTAERTEHDMKLANGASDQALSMGGIATGTALYLTTDKQITVKLGGTDKDPITVDRMLFLVGEFTSIHLGNASGDTAEVKATVLGK